MKLITPPTTGLTKSSSRRSLSAPSRTHFLEKRQVAFMSSCLAVGDDLPDESTVPALNIGSLSMMCEHCGAFSFAREKVHCCHHGKVKVEPDAPFPKSLEKMYEEVEFVDNARAYNNACAMGSFGAKAEHLPSTGPPSLRLHGQVYRRIGSLEPRVEEGQPRMYGQVYILDAQEAEQATNERMQNPVTQSNCNPDRLTKLHEILADINPYAQNYRVMHDVAVEEEAKAKEAGMPVKKVKMVFLEKKRQDTAQSRRYSKPVERNEVAAVYATEDGKPLPPHNRDIVVHLKHSGLQFLPYFSRHTDGLLYPLLFPTGHNGWVQGEQQLGSTQRVTLRKHYQYITALRMGFNAIHRAGKLTQQFILDAYLKAEANELHYASTHQREIRGEELDTLRAAVGEGSNDAEQAGHIILPKSFALIISTTWIA
mmetsp:Transcript_28963/g.50268  ORF Transcript_28963/g.50268 Transcript_28963/m.50268 type:complete len:425 (-) Transcript_28963:285-1559(-)